MFCFKVIIFKSAKSNFYSLRTCSTVREILINQLGIQNNVASTYIQRHKLKKKKPSSVKKVIEFCKSINFTNEQILNQPNFLRGSVITLEQRYYTLIEGGFYDITPEMLARLVMSSTIEDLRQTKIIKEKIDIIESLSDHMNPRLPLEDLKITYKEEDTFKSIHNKLQREYLKFRLNTNDEAIDRLYKIFGGIQMKSFYVISELLNLAKDLGYTDEKILKCGYILSSPLRYPKTTLEKFPNLCGMDMRYAMWLYPKIFGTSPDNIEEIHKILKDNNIPDETIKKTFNVFHLSPETVKFRLNELKRIPDFKVLMYHPNILKLVVHHNRAKSRLAFLKKIQIKCAGISILGRDKECFNVAMREGYDRLCPEDVYGFLTNKLERNQIDYVDRLKKHKFFLRVSLISMEATIDYLKSKKFSVDDIIDVIWIVLYPKSYVEDAFKEIDKIYARRKLNPKIRLNLAIYFMEKEHSFTGNGIWENEDGIEHKIEL